MPAVVDVRVVRESRAVLRSLTESVTDRARKPLIRNAEKSAKTGTRYLGITGEISVTCGLCGRDFRARRRDAQYCSARCRQRDRRARLLAEAER